MKTIITIILLAVSLVCLSGCQVGYAAYCVLFDVDYNTGIKRSEMQKPAEKKPIEQSQPAQ